MTPTLDYNAALFAFLQTSLNSFQEAINDDGRELKLLDDMAYGDTLVFADRRLLWDFVRANGHLVGDIRLTVVDPKSLHLPGPFRGIPKGSKVHFHHSWIEAYWLHAIKSANQSINVLDVHLKELTKNVGAAE